MAQAIQQFTIQKANGNTDAMSQQLLQWDNKWPMVTISNQVLVQVSNQVINNIKNVNNNINNFNNINVNTVTPQEKTIITQTIDTFKAPKPHVPVPTIFITFGGTHLRYLVLRTLSTSNAIYDMPFSKNTGPFTLNDNKFKANLDGKGKILHCISCKNLQ